MVVGKLDESRPSASHYDAVRDRGFVILLVFTGSKGSTSMKNLVTFQKLVDQAQEAFDAGDSQKGRDYLRQFDDAIEDTDLLPFDRVRLREASKDIHEQLEERLHTVQGRIELEKRLDKNIHLPPVKQFFPE